MGVQQKLMRHAHISTTMDQYGNASAVEKRKANRPIVERVLGRKCISNSRFNNKRELWTVPLLDTFGQSPFRQQRGSSQHIAL